MTYLPPSNNDQSPANTKATSAELRKLVPTVTIRDVAAMSGASIKTVSRVLNNEPNVRPEMRERVLQAAHKLNYHPNMAARSLAGRQSYMIGLFYENPSPNYAINVQTGALDRLRGESYRLLMFPVENFKEFHGKMIAIIRSSGLAGVILTPPMSNDPELMEELDQSGVPYVRVAGTEARAGSPRIIIKDMIAAREMTRYLIGLGHQRIAFIRGDPIHPASSARFEGYCYALKSAGIPFDPDLVVAGDFRFTSGLAAARKLFALNPRPTAVFSSNDDMAAGIVQAAHEHGISVPRELSVVGFDDSQLASIVWPRITTMRQPISAMAYTATDIILNLLEHGWNTEETRTVELDHALIIRESAGPPPLPPYAHSKLG
ncbi:MAG: LacI family DNA-binding transcriptional regulator [Zymomonas mobilis subsp. pomaceae]|uniref:Transcriptional regulator, LacI family n=1 Tax=Zymomonas mobilis subsp. pomaceae (strain ATCC 29192 / DSM 22645 / JCM 10191 / CCUG 17912 / NBRC 13757 / NCIMB 11200 / NRRL B-4491 / Barker I) TaxID=579138 RepID=F8ET60_ZYMMT|nr:LacI family DNA-binding transcriptional regulator [Zymomonas mobilis]AEI36950.1 transcriptional regulator, LacI family [Zymomonas mobilis subsp. pomaceae ATCC 29192]MDX5948323.1 LacI family DNA-binding transcriptional regulator [Zymomonas mobilis subsp. pomaceae]GEB89079.1 LacI family transcriptional regulator [Zymomonas mobilis subsp. pomaceae]